MRRAISLLWLAALSPGVAWPLEARAGNADTYHLSNDAAIVGGAITATVKGGGALWYNPAGLAADERSSVDVSANAYVVRFGGNPDLVADAGASSAQKQLSSFEFYSVPTSLAFTRRFGGVSLGLGIFVPNQRVLLPRTLIRVFDESGRPRGALAVDGNTRYSDSYTGLGAGFNLGPGLRLGASLFLFHSSLQETNGTLLADERAVNGRAQLMHETIDRFQVGAQLVWGLKWTPSPRWSVGLTMRSPVVQFFHIPNRVVMSVDTGPDGANAARHTVVFDDQTGFSTAILRPMRGHLGVARVEDKMKYSFEVSALAPYYDAETGAKSHAVLNYRAGARWRVSQPLAVGAGLHTDFSQASDQTASTVIDYYGVSIGTEFGAAFKALSEDDPTTPPRRTVSTTTLALGYALGTGHLANEALGTLPDGTLTVHAAPAHVVAHEVMLYLGSSVAF